MLGCIPSIVVSTVPVRNGRLDDELEEWEAFDDVSADGRLHNITPLKLPIRLSMIG